MKYNKILKPKKFDNFNIVPGYIFRDKGISIGATGLYAYLFSHTADQDITIEFICGHFKEGKDAIRAKIKELILKSSGYVNVQGSNNLASLFSKRGEKGVNQDCALVWEGFGCQEDMIFCGIFDGHGPWGHYVAKQVRNSMPLSLLCIWQKILAQATLEPELDLEGSNKKNLKIRHMEAILSKNVCNG